MCESANRLITTVPIAFVSRVCLANVLDMPPALSKPVKKLQLLNRKHFSAITGSCSKIVFCFLTWETNGEIISGKFYRTEQLEGKIYHNI